MNSANQILNVTVSESLREAGARAPRGDFKAGDYVDGLTDLRPGLRS